MKKIAFILAVISSPAFSDGHGHFGYEKTHSARWKNPPQGYHYQQIYNNDCKCYKFVLIPN